MRTHVDEPQRPIGELFADLVQQTGSLVKSEVALATTELKAKAVGAARDGAKVGVGAAIALLGALALLAALILGLGTVMPLWLAALLVGAVLTGVGAAVAFTGVKRLEHLDPVPRETVQTLKENKRWLSEQVSR